MYIDAGTINTATTKILRTAGSNSENHRFRISNTTANTITINITYDGVAVFSNVILAPKGANTNACFFEIDLAPTKVLAVVTTTTDTLTYYISGGDI